MRLAAPTSKNCFLWRVALFDVFWALVAPFIALSMRDPSLLEIPVSPLFLSHSYQYAAVAFVVAMPIFLFFRLSEGLSHYFSARDLSGVLAATLTTATGSTLAIFFVNRLEGIPRSTPLIYGLVLGSGLLGWRAIANRSRVNHDVVVVDGKPHLRRVILIGIDRFAAIAIKLTDCQQPRTTQFVAALDARDSLTKRTINGVKIVGNIADLEPLIVEYAVHGIEVDEVWISDQSVPESDASRIKHLCSARGIKVFTISQALNLRPLRSPVLAAPAVARMITPNAGYFRFKRCVDVVASSLLLFLLTPVVIPVACLAYLDVGAPVIFWQRRIGRSGREFMVLKFRTFQAPYARNGATVPNDARLSRIGKAIRATRFDEIPQLINILRGDMSLIGPRPLLPVDQPEDPRLRLLVRPGVTGWAQVNGGALVSAAEKDAMDVWYIHHASLKLDIEIVFRTLATIFRGDNKESVAIKTATHWYENIRRA